MFSIKSFLAASLLVSSVLSQTSDISSLSSQLAGDPTTFTLFSTTSYLSGTSISILSNSTHSLVSYNMSSTLVSEFGWIGLGFNGSTMAAAEQIVMAWPDPSKSGTWVLSNRKATGNSRPGVATNNPPTLLSSISSAPHTLNYLIENSGSSKFSFIYAFSSSSVDSSDPDTTNLVQHNDGDFGSFTGNLLASAGLDSQGQATTTTTTAQSSSTSDPLTKFDQLIILHAIMAATAWMIISPAAVLMGRLGRHLGKTWFNIHWAFQVLLTTALTIAAIILAIIAVNTNGGFSMSYHAIAGFILLLLVLCQISLGYYIHRKLDSNRIKRPVRNIGHIFLGLTISVLAYVQVHSGLELYSTFRSIPSYLFTLFWILACSPFAIYIMSIISLIISRRKEGLTWGMAAFGLGRVGGHEIPQGVKTRSFDLESQTSQTSREKLILPQESYNPRQKTTSDSYPYFNTVGSTASRNQYLPRVENQLGGNFVRGF